MAEADPTLPPDGSERRDAGVLRPTSMPLPRRTSRWQGPVALALAVPALILLLTSYVLPTVWALRTSLRTVSVVRGAPGGADGAASSGLVNYRLTFDNGFGRSLGLALSLAVVPLIVVTVLAPLLAWAAHRSGTGVRRTARALLALPLACFAPVAVAVGWRSERIERYAAASDAAGLVREVTWLASLGLVCALAVTWYLAALRRVDAHRRAGPALAVAGALAVLATVAAAVQAFTYPYLLTAGGRGTETPVMAMFLTGLVDGEFGPAAAIAIMVTVILAVLGVIAWALVMVSGLRLEVDTDAPAGPRGAPTPRWRALPPVTAAVLLVAVLGVTVYALAPWLRHATSSGDLTAPVSGTRIFVNTWVPPLISTGIGVAVAALAAFGIGALRPLGRASELLLLPFAPYLFVGIAPVALRAYAAGATADRFDNLIGLIPPNRLEVPALFLFTLLFRGQAMRAEQRRQRGGVWTGWWRGFLRPALPMVGVVALATWVLRAQDLLWPALSGSGPHATGPVRLAAQVLGVNGSPGEPPYALAMHPVVLVLLVVLAVVAQVTYLDRVALRIGRPEYPGGPRT